MKSYYNEWDKYAAQWLRNLIAEGLIPDGDVDERSICDVRASDLAGYTQCHFFAGIAGWPHALRLAGWPNDRPVWTGSCPCQPFSQAGKGKGEQDERHLWPHFRELIAERKPATVFGEQVASKAGRGWLDGVRADLEAVAYEVGAADLCSAGVGAPHIRQRLYWVANSDSAGRQSVSTRARICHEGDNATRTGKQSGISCHAGRLGDSDLAGSQGWSERPVEHADQRAIGEAGASSWLADSNGREPRNGHVQRSRQHGFQPQNIGSSFWSDFDIVHCLDGKARRIEPGTFPLATGVPARMGKLRAYGNAITPQVAAQFIGAYLESERVA